MEGHIKNHAATARKVGREKIVRVLQWIYRWGWSSRAIIAQVAGDEPRYAARLVKKGLLRRIEHPSTRLLPAAYVLTDMGLALAIDHLSGLLEWNNAPIDYPWAMNRSRIAWSYFEHGLDVQRAMIHFGCHHDASGSWWASEREMRKEQHRGPVPDAMILETMGDDDQIIWIEVERTFKNEEQRSLQLWDRLQALKAGRFGKIKWIYTTLGLGLALRRALDVPLIPKTWRDESSHIWREPSLGESPRPLWNASSFSFLGEDPEV